MKFIQREEYPLRMYIEDSRESISALSASIHQKYYYENQYLADNYPNRKYDDNGEVDNLIFEDDTGEAYFPAGIVSIIKDAANKLGYTVDVEYLEETKELVDSIDVRDDIINGITLRDYQIESIKASLIYHRGLIQSPTGSGKSSMMIGVAKYLLENTNINIIMTVPTAYLLHQTYQNNIDAGISDNDIFRLGDGYSLETNKRIMIATVQTLYRRVDNPDDEMKDWLSKCDCLLMDEVQHLSARTWYTVADTLQPKYLIGFSAEPFYSDKEHMIKDLITRGTLGPILYRVTMKDLVDRGYVSKPFVISMDSKFKGNIYQLINWHQVYKLGIVDNTYRNQMICDVADTMIQLNKNPLILIQQIKHGELLAKAISASDRKVAFITGGSSVTVYQGGIVTDSYKDTEGIVKSEFSKGLIDCIIGTTTLDEGVDMPTISSVILAGGQKTSIRIIQRIGRGLRKKAGDNTTFIFDFTDRFNVVLQKHYKLRKQTYDKNQIPVYFASNVNEVEYLVNKYRES